MTSEAKTVVDLLTRAPARCNGGRRDAALVALKADLASRMSRSPI